ncbi:tRNA dihydrouridine synthase DusB [Pseudomaricurvus alcaniphilus]|uniref:tRNA dihydrouridine synthase DusB n=1 Tax=Pseudomaricurvus alcaniphilus TaxID=1166482 RepID=UPI0014087FA5|nr:tRNA dihydrouridine synthase DusB [Pseudomaricurvus alcaniphilus]NHN37019.1 tRNA dihydrouridine synthase DusB [Pseudomaricurvus alcaniphilus]
MFHIGPYHIENRVVLAPMAGVTDQPFRQLCRRLGAGLAISEMVTADSRLWNSRKSQTRMNHSGENEPRAVQIAGADPEMMASAARLNVARGAQIIDINMGCPAKKVCKKAAGSALLRDEPLVQAILQAVTAAVQVPVTLKYRTGWSRDNRNAVTIAKLAQDSGIAALSVHGRTRECAYSGAAEYDTIAAVVESVDLPVIANGDIDTPAKAREVLDYTGAAAVMIGRGAQGRPWIFREINHFLATGATLPAPDNSEINSLLGSHVAELHQFYGEFMGLRIARKHVGWYLKTIPGSTAFRQSFNQITAASEQRDRIQEFFEQLNEREDKAA